MKLAICLLSLAAFGLANSAYATFLPENMILNREPAEGPPNITEPQFNALVSSVQAAFAPIVKKHGGNLSVTGDWRSEQPNAGATQMFGQWRVQITGALARRPELTPDAFVLILCHELGHHLGGFALAGNGNPFMGVWAANEGQSDYFATQVCARKLWAPERDKNAEFRELAKPFARERCDQAWTTQEERDLCYRVVVGSESVTATMAALMKKPVPELHTPDPAEVSKTLDAHPAVQCRLDTSFQGALCPAVFDHNLIPGKKAPGGPFGLGAEEEAARNSCTKKSGYVFGLRPACWFKARM